MRTRARAGGVSPKSSSDKAAPRSPTATEAPRNPTPARAVADRGVGASSRVGAALRRVLLGSRDHEVAVGHAHRHALARIEERRRAIYATQVHHGLVAELVGRSGLTDPRHV